MCRGVRACAKCSRRAYRLARARLVPFLGFFFLPPRRPRPDPALNVQTNHRPKASLISSVRTNAVASTLIGGSPPFNRSSRRRLARSRPATRRGIPWRSRLAGEDGQHQRVRHQVDQLLHHGQSVGSAQLPPSPPLLPRRFALLCSCLGLILGSSFPAFARQL